MKKILLVLITTILFSCSSDKYENCCTIIDIAVNIKYVNENGENLFETDNPINIGDIKVFHKIDSDWVEYYQGNLDYPKGLREQEINGEKFLTISTSIESGEDNISETKLKFSDNNEDIIKTELNLNGNNIIITKVWYNDELKWQTEDKKPREFTIEK